MSDYNYCYVIAKEYKKLDFLLDYFPGSYETATNSLYSELNPYSTYATFCREELIESISLLKNSDNLCLIGAYIGVSNKLADQIIDFTLGKETKREIFNLGVNIILTHKEYEKYGSKQLKARISLLLWLISKMYGYVKKQEEFNLEETINSILAEKYLDNFYIAFGIHLILTNKLYKFNQGVMNGIVTYIANTKSSLKSEQKKLYMEFLEKYKPQSYFMENLIFGGLKFKQAFSELYNG